jgi:hypothetical protein
VQIDDLKGKNEPVAEGVEGVSPLKDEHGTREPGPPTPEEACDTAIHRAVVIVAASLIGSPYEFVCSHA